MRQLCKKYPGEYWREKDRLRAYPAEFVAELTKSGFLAALIPEQYGGQGLAISEACVIMEEVRNFSLLDGGTREVCF